MIQIPHSPPARLSQDPEAQSVYLSASTESELQVGLNPATNTLGPQPVQCDSSVVNGGARKRQNVSAQPRVVSSSYGAKGRSLCDLPPELGLLVLKNSPPSGLMALASTNQSQRRLAHVFLKSVPTASLLTKLAQEPTSASKQFFYEELVGRLKLVEPTIEKVRPWKEFSAVLMNYSFATVSEVQRRRDQFAYGLPYAVDEWNRYYHNAELSARAWLCCRIESKRTTSFPEDLTVVRLAARIGSWTVCSTMIDKLHEKTVNTRHLQNASYFHFRGQLDQLVEVVLYSALIGNQRGILCALVEHPIYREQFRSERMEAVLERAIFSAATYPDAANLLLSLMQPAIKDVVSEKWALYHEDLLARAKMDLNPESCPSAERSAIINQLATEGRIRDWEYSLDYIRTLSGQRRGFHAAARRYGAAMLSGDSDRAEKIEASKNLGQFIHHGWGERLSRRRAVEYANSLFNRGAEAPILPASFVALNALVGRTAMLPFEDSHGASRFVLRLMYAFQPA